MINSEGTKKPSNTEIIMENGRNSYEKKAERQEQNGEKTGEFKMQQNYYQREKQKRSMSYTQNKSNNSNHNPLWISAVKDQQMYQPYKHNSTSTNNHILQQYDYFSGQGKLYRGISFKGQQRIKYNQSEKKQKKQSKQKQQQHKNQNQQDQQYKHSSLYSSLNQKNKQKPNVMDLIGSNLTTKRERGQSQGKGKYYHELRGNIQVSKNKERQMNKNMDGSQSKDRNGMKNSNNQNFFQYVMRFSYKTKKGYSPSNPYKINQDNYITCPNINSKTWQHLFGICDGHGPLGHLVSSYIKSNLPKCISQIKSLQQNPINSLNKGFQICYQKLMKESKIDLAFSGSTVVICYFNKDKVYCCNVGDSRVIMGKRVKVKGQGYTVNDGKGNKQYKWTGQALSIDHKPSIPLQAQRINKMKGRVQAYKDQYGEDIGPLRVWLRHQNTPGLAMSRSFGDLIAASVGVSHQPQIKQFTLTQQCKILLIGSDGVFEFLSNQQIIDQLSPFYEKKRIQQASDHLLYLAHNSWGKNSTIVDDITFVLIFLSYGDV